MDDEGDTFGNDDDDEWLNVQDALGALRSRDLTEAPAEVEEAVWKRISGYVMNVQIMLKHLAIIRNSYPGAALQHVHVAKAFLPIDIAKALSQSPSLVQRAVETFYTRDASQLRVSLSHLCAS